MLGVVAVRHSAVTMHAREDPQARELRQQMRPAVAHERQRYAGHRQETQIHADVYEYMGDI